jgi:hypothetical protein
MTCYGCDDVIEPGEIAVWQNSQVWHIDCYIGTICPDCKGGTSCGGDNIRYCVDKMEKINGEVNYETVP